MSVTNKPAAPASLRCIGESSDGRTNRWRITCECGKDFEPSTTRFARRIEECPKCGQRWAVDYNTPEIKKATL